MVPITKMYSWVDLGRKAFGNAQFLNDILCPVFPLSRPQIKLFLLAKRYIVPFQSYSYTARPGSNNLDFPLAAVIQKNYSRFKAIIWGYQGIYLVDKV